MNVAKRSSPTFLVMGLRPDAPPQTHRPPAEYALWVRTTLDPADRRLTLDLTVPGAVMAVDGGGSRSFNRWLRSIRGRHPGCGLLLVENASLVAAPDRPLFDPNSHQVRPRSVCQPHGLAGCPMPTLSVERKEPVSLHQVAYRVIVGVEMTRVEHGISWLTQRTAAVLPESSSMHVRAALIELIVNAVEHGNLEITYLEKQEALAAHRYDALLAARRRHPRIARRKVVVDAVLCRNPHRIRYTVSDDGQGFDWQGLAEKMRDTTPSQNASGRGLQLVRSLFPDLCYYEKGTVASFSVRLP